MLEYMYTNDSRCPVEKIYAVMYIEDFGYLRGWFVQFVYTHKNKFSKFDLGFICFIWYLSENIKNWLHRRTDHILLNVHIKRTHPMEY